MISSCLCDYTFCQSYGQGGIFVLIRLQDRAEVSLLIVYRVLLDKRHRLWCKSIYRSKRGIFRVAV